MARIGDLLRAVGASVSFANSMCGRTMARYNGINADEDNAVNNWLTMKSNGLAVFTEDKPIPELYVIFQYL